MLLTLRTDVAWGKTRVVVGEGKKRKVLAALDEEVFDKSMIPMRKFGDYQAQAWQDEQPEPAPQFAQMPSTTFRTSYSPSVMSRAPSAQFMGGHSPLPGTPPVPSPYHHSPSHTPFGSLSSTSNLQLAMPMPVMPYNAWAPPPGSYAGSGHGNSVVGTPSEHGRPTSYAPSFAMDRGRSASIGSQLSAFRSSSPFVANGAMPSPSLNTEPR
jgi:chitin synthase